MDYQDFVPKSLTQDKVLISDPDVSLLTLEQMEKMMIEKSLLTHKSNISKVADELGLSRAALYRRLDKHGIIS